jgi:AcrR family transcriptional regulator
MRDILRESGMSAGAVYLYFKSKDELIEAIAESRHLREREWIASALERGDVAKSLWDLTQSFAKVLMDREEQQERRLAIQLWAESLLDPKIRASVLEGVDIPTNLLSEFFKSAQKKGEFPKSLDCRSAARVLVALYQGLVLQVAWDPSISLTPHLKIIQSMLHALTAGPQE